MSLPAPPSSGFDLIVLCDNEARSGFDCVGGLCFLLRSPDCTVLWDTAMDSVAVDNADRLGVDLTQVDVIALSHGHYDHTGGLPSVLERTGEVRLVAHPGAFEGQFGRRGPDEVQPIGPRLSVAELAELGADVELTADPVPLGATFTTTGQVPRGHQKPGATPGLLRERDGELAPDEFPDDVSVVAKLPAGLIIITGCAHAGLVNIVKHAQDISGVERVIGLFGGTHLVAYTDDEVREIARALADLGLETLAASHCTGTKAFEVLRDAFPGELRSLRAGDCLRFDDQGVASPIN